MREIILPNWPGSGVVVSGGSEPGAAGVAAHGKVLAVAPYLTDPLQPAAVDWSINYFSKANFYKPVPFF